MTGDAARRGELLDELDHWRKRALFAEEQWAYMGEQATAWQRRAERWERVARLYRRIAQDRAGNNWAAKPLIRAMRFTRGLVDHGGHRLPNDFDGMTYREWTGKEPLELPR